MDITKQYKVAGHSFRITLPESETLSAALSQYEPFEDNSGENILFEISLEKGPTPYTKEETIYDTPTEDGETVVKLFSCSVPDCGKRYLFEISRDCNCPVCARLFTDEEFTHGRIELEKRTIYDAVFAVNNAAMLLYAFTTCSLNTLEMHASVIENSGRAFLFLGRSGTGKSTHSNLWLKHIEGSELMNDDNPVVRVNPDGSVTAYGSPWSGKTPCYKNVKAPIGAFVQIRQCPRNEIRHMDILEAYAALYSSSSGLKTNGTMADGLHDTMEKIATGIPFYLLDCRPDEEAATLCHSTVCK